MSPYGSRREKRGTIRPLAWLLMAAGIVLAVMGVNAMNAASSDVDHFYAGAPAERAARMLVLGVAMLVAGLAGFLPAFRARKRRYFDYDAESGQSPLEVASGATGFPKIVPHDSAAGNANAHASLQVPDGEMSMGIDPPAVDEAEEWPQPADGQIDRAPQRMQGRIAHARSARH